MSNSKTHLKLVVDNVPTKEQMMEMSVEEIDEIMQRTIERTNRKKMEFEAELMGIDVKPQYHLNHDRGGPEIQR